MTTGLLPTHLLSSTGVVQRLIRTAYPYGSLRTIKRGPLKNFRLVVCPSMGFTYIWSMDGSAWDWVRLITAEQCVYDIGANCGQSTLHLARAVGHSGRVIAFEPVPLNFRRLVRNIELNALTQVMPVCAAASASDSEGSFEFSEHMSTQGRLVSLGQDNTRRANFETIKVQQIRLDSYKVRGWPAPSFLKIDVEGGAAAVLSGAGNIFMSCRPTVYIELHSRDEQAAVRDLLRDHRYRAYSLAGQAVEDPTVQWVSPLLCRPL
jgi:FkbM family methyltransferase